MGHAGGMSAHRDGVSHWDDVYAVGDASRSWFQTCPLMSLKMLDAAGVTASDSLIDVVAAHHAWPVRCLAGDSGTSLCWTSP
jgi:hypothetical protein